ncbi:class I adenylate-forming enzyme family protein [Desulfatitalea tepidiphila]|uniref:class I adenylate-forming enzyme family protein n=1 Tax=Desulfatitalea tepidiphila TaxID=1185843 RepID=UPI0006B41769|nr:long-chain-fatty-acid--CoA ligase [Desulfatitalea tepidiphila]
MLVHEILEYTAARLPDKTALIEGDQEMSFGHVLSQVTNLSTRLSEMGIDRGDRVALLLPNCIEFCVAYFAILRLGAIVVPLNNRLSPKEFVYIVNDAAPRAIILGYQFWETFRQFKNELKITPDLIYAGEAPKEGALFFAEIVEAPLASSAESIRFGSDEPACIMYTSGTTGLPKGAVMSHRNVFTNARNAGAHMGYRERDTTLIVVPLFHVTGLNTQLVAFFYTGGTTVIMRAYDTGGMIELLARHKVTTMITVPTVYKLMLVHPSVEKADLSALRDLSYGGAPMDTETINALRKKLGVDLFNAYGLTETSSLATCMPACDTDRKGASVGLPVSGIQLRVVDFSGNDLPCGSIGELWIKGPNVVRSYWNKPEATAANLADGWLRTGDFARIDDEGFVYIADRKKDMINRGGENVYSIEVESAILANPDVLETAVVPRSHSIFGEVVHAFVVPAPGRNPTQEEIIRTCRNLIADYKVPASVSFVKELPRNPGGKVIKARLRELVPPGDPPRS